MSEQPDMFELPPYQRHSVTSLQAAVLAEPLVNALQAKVFAQIKLCGGATDEELQVALGLNPSTQRPRRIELVEKGLVRDSGKTRKTAANRNAVVWETVPKP